MTLAEKQSVLVEELRRLPGVQERFGALVARARALPPLGQEFKTDANRIEGCLARLWLSAEFKDGCCWFGCDSDSLVTKGVAGLLCELYSGALPEEIVAFEPHFLRELGITQHLTPNRRNGLAQVHRRIREFAERHLVKHGSDWHAEHE
jgi:cysteine desulfuration protein SufE